MSIIDKKEGDEYQDSSWENITAEKNGNPKEENEILLSNDKEESTEAI